MRGLRCILWKSERKLFTFLRRKPETILIINPVHSSEVGFVAYFVHVLSMISYADRRRMIPVVDMQSSLNTYLYENEVGSVNAWEYYFEQPGGVALEEALREKNSVHAEAPVSSFSKPNSSRGFYFNYGGELDYWREICRKYIHFSEHLQSRIEHEKQKFTNRRVLGVSLRGTDYTAGKYRNHSRQPDTGQVILKVKDVIAEHNFDAVYLSTEDKNIVAEFQTHFGSVLILPEQEYIDFDSSKRKVITLYSHSRNNDKYLNGLEYLSAKLLLCECSGLITSMSGGAVLAMLFSRGFEYFYVFDLGVY